MHVNTHSEISDPPSVAHTSDLKSLQDFKSCKGLKLLHLNVRSLLPKLDLVQVLITEACPDIFVLTETWLSGKVSDSELSIHGYKLFRVDRKSKGGGVLIYVKKILAVRELAASSVPKHFEYIILDVCLGGNIHIQVMGIYRPPSAPLMALEELGKVLSSVASIELIILGDLNLDWLSDNSGSLKELCLELNLSQLINSFTRPNPKKPANSTLIDLILTNKPFKYPYTGVFSQGISDHCPTACVRMVKGLKLKARSILK